MIRKLLIIALFLLLGCAEIDEAGGETPVPGENIGVELQAFAPYCETMDALREVPWDAIFAPGYRFQLVTACIPDGAGARYRFCRTTTWSHTIPFQIYNPLTGFCEIRTTYVPRKIDFDIDELRRLFGTNAGDLRLIQNGAVCDLPVPTLQDWVEGYE